jgi:hypothetical protein
MEESLKNLKNRLRKDCRKIPPFLDHTRAIERTIFDMSILFFECLDRLITNEILSNKKIKYIVFDSEMVVNEMFDVNNNLSYLYYDYFNKVIYAYIDYCEKEELWEVASNFKNFYELLFKEKLIKKND